MKKIIVAASLFLFVFTTANAQITKGNWLMGGNGSYSRSNQTSDFAAEKVTRLNLSPNVGYFFIDKLAGGIRAVFNYEHYKHSFATSRRTTFDFGPFARYYFLHPDKLVNLFSEAAVLINTFKADAIADNTYAIYSFTGGIAVFLNSSVAIEGGLNYELLSRQPHNTRVKTLAFKVGFQIHLQKEKE